MTTYTTTIRWTRTGDSDFTNRQYSRAHLFVIASGAKQSSPALAALDCVVAFGSSQ